MKTEKNILAPFDFIIRKVNAHPSLYASPSYDETKFRILDHVLNTIGNGCYMESFEGDPVTDLEIAKAKKWFHCERAAYGYMKTRKLGDSSFEMPEGEPIVVREDEMKDHPEIVYWVDFDASEERNPYPNFMKEYSAVWNNRDIIFEELGPQWAKVAGWYYNRCRDYFMDSEKVKSYYGAFPNKDQEENEQRLASYLKLISSTEKYPTNDDISKAYECEFIGDRTNIDDVSAFATRRWEKEHQRILDFIYETLARVNSLIMEQTVQG